MSTAEDSYYLQNVNQGCEQVYCYTPNDEQFVNNQAAQHANNNTVAEFPQHSLAEYHVEEGYQNEYFVDSNSPDQTIQHFDHTMDRQEHHEHHTESYTAAYAYNVDFNSQNLIVEQSDDSLLPDNNIDVPNFSEPQGQYVKYNMSSNDFTSALQEYDLSKTIDPIKKKNVQKLEAPSITVFPDCSYLYSESETKRIISLPLWKRGRLVPRNLLERIVYELRVRKIRRHKFAKNVLGRSTNIFYDILHSPEEWDQLRSTRRKQFEKMKEWLDMSEERKKAAVERENTEEKCRTVFTQAQREALESYFEKFPEAWKPDLVGLADQLQLPWRVVSTYFTNQRGMRKNMGDQQQ